MKFAIDKKTLLIILIGFLSGFYVRVVGVLCVAELIALLIAAYVVLTNKISFTKNKQFKNIIILNILAFVGTIISGVVNGSSFIDITKWLFTIFLFVVDLIAVFWLLSDKVTRIIYYLFFSMIGVLLTSTILPQFSVHALVNVENEVIQKTLSERLDLNAELFAYQYAPIFLFLIAFLYGKMPKLTIAIMFFAGVFFLFGDSRHLFLIYELAAVIMMFLGVVNEQNKMIKMQKMRKNVLPFLIILFGTAIVIKSSYEYMAKNGILGEWAQYKYELQSSNNNDIVLGSRMITFEGLYIILKDPIWGFGPYAVDKNGYAQEFARMMNAEYDSSKILGGHSYLVQFWTYGGILALLLWLYVFYLGINFIINGIVYEPRLTPFLLIFVILLLYNILFSPFGNRISNACVLVIISVILNNAKMYNNHIENKYESDKNNSGNAVI